MKIPSKDYGRQYEPLLPEILTDIQKALLHDKPVLGEAVALFEQDFASYHGVAYAIGVGSGTDAIVLSLRAAGISKGDEVITCAHTFSGVLSAIIQSGASPILVEPDEYGQLDPDEVASKITPSTKAILAVHFYGHPVQADVLARIAADNQLVLIEDIAQAHGAKWKERSLGSFGAISALSFHPSKNLGAFGDGGAILTENKEMADQLRVLRNLGKSDKYQFDDIAPNSKLDTLQAIILRIKLKHLDSWVQRRTELANRYIRGLTGIGDLRLPKVHPDARPAWHLFVLRSKHREALQEHLKKAGIRTGLHYPIAAHQQPAIQKHLGQQSFPIAENWAAECLTLPLSHEHRDDEIDTVIHHIQRFFAAR